MENVETTIWNFGSKIFEGGLLAFGIRAAFILVVAKIVAMLVNNGFKKAADKNEDQKMSLHFACKVVRFIIYTIAAFSILSGISPLKGLGTALLGATSIFSVVVGLAAQESFGNFIAGFFLALYHPFNVGDMVVLKEKNISGRVKEITFRHTILISVEGTKLVIPNSVMNSAIIEDREFGQNIYTKYMDFTVAYGSDIEVITKIVYDAVLSTDGVVDVRTEEERKEGKNPFPVRLDAFEDSGLKILFPLNTEDLSASFAAASDVRKKLLKGLAENHIDIPYPIVQVRLEKKNENAYNQKC